MDVKQYYYYYYYYYYVGNVTKYCNYAAEAPQYANMGSGTFSPRSSPNPPTASQGRRGSSMTPKKRSRAAHLENTQNLDPLGLLSRPIPA